MTTEREAMDLLVPLQQAFPARKIPPETMLLYAAKLARFPDRAIKKAVDEAIDFEKSWPSLASLRARCSGTQGSPVEDISGDRLLEPWELPGYVLHAGIKHTLRDGSIVDEGDFIGPDGLHRGIPNRISERAGARLCERLGWTRAPSLRMGRDHIGAALRSGEVPFGAERRRHGRAADDDEVPF
jgi:hypothetical protein